MKTVRITDRSVERLGSLIGCGTVLLLASACSSRSDADNESWFSVAGSPSGTI
jgi:hypothetical protein